MVSLLVMLGLRDVLGFGFVRSVSKVKDSKMLKTFQNVVTFQLAPKRKAVFISIKFT